MKPEEAVLYTNMVDELDGDTLGEIGQRVYDDYLEDEGSRKDWIERYENNIEIAAQVYKRRTFPWINSSNIKFPLMSIAALQFHARAYPALVPNDGLVTAKITGRDPDGAKRMIGERIGMHMTYQIREQMDGWESGMDKLLITLPITGSEFKKTYYDPELGQVVSEHVLARDLVINYFAEDLETATRKTQIIQMGQNEVIEKQRSGLFSDRVDLTQPIPREDRVTKVQERSQGVNRPNYKHPDDAPYMILEWHGYWDLDGDGYKEPYIVTIEKETRQVLRMVARFQPENVVRNEVNKVVKIYPDEYFTHYRFVPSPDGGFYGLGFGMLLGPLNETVNTLINQLVDAGTLSNLQSGFISRNLRIRGGNWKFNPGEWKFVNASGQDLKTSILPLPVREPSQTLFALMQLLISYGERLTSTTDINVGENPGQNQKATTSMLVHQEGQRVFTAVYKRIRVAMENEFKRIFQLNKFYMDAVEYFDVIDPNTGDQQTLQINLTDYQITDGIDVRPSADPSGVSQMQRLARAQMLMELMPTGLVNPAVVIRRVLDAAEVPNYEELLQMPPPQPDPEILLKQQELQLKAVDSERQYELGKEKNEIARDQADVARATNLGKLEDMEADTNVDIAKTQAEFEFKDRELDLEARRVAVEEKKVQIEAKKAATEAKNPTSKEGGSSESKQPPVVVNVGGGKKKLKKDPKTGEWEVNSAE